MTAPSVSALFDELEKIAEEQEPLTFGEFLKYRVAGPALHMALPVAAGVGAGYLAGGGALEAARHSPAVMKFVQGLTPEAQRRLATIIRHGGVVGGGLAGAGLAHQRAQVYEELEQLRQEARERDEG